MLNKCPSLSINGDHNFCVYDSFYFSASRSGEALINVDRHALFVVVLVVASSSLLMFCSFFFLTTAYGVWLSSPVIETKASIRYWTV